MGDGKSTVALGLYSSTIFHQQKAIPNQPSKINDIASPVTMTVEFRDKTVEVSWESNGQSCEYSLERNPSWEGVYVQVCPYLLFHYSSHFPHSPID